jgi:ABC-2 type transport system ATP-binding protein
LTKFYGATAAIKNVSFTVEPGEVVGFLGPNGAGKSTTLRILSGLLRADRGEAYVNGVSVARNPSQVKKHLGFMPENNPLPEDLRVVEYLRHRARLKDLPRRERSARIDEVLEACDLNRTARRKLIGSLSKGFRQRVGLADSILSRPAVTILDEPTIGLDPHQILQIRRLIEGLKGRTTVMLSSHILAEVEISCDRVIILNRGVIVASGAPRALREEFFPGRRYELNIAGKPETLASAIDTVDLKCRIEEPTGETDDDFRTVYLQYTSSEDLSERLIAAISSTDGLRLKHFSAHPVTLEDIFLAATKRSWEVEMEPEMRISEEVAAK